MGWSRTQFDRLPETEQDDWLAFDHWRRAQLLDMLKSMKQMIDGGKHPDGGAYAAVWLSLLEA